MEPARRFANGQFFDDLRRRVRLLPVGFDFASCLSYPGGWSFTCIDLTEICEKMIENMIGRTSIVLSTVSGEKYG